MELGDKRLGLNPLAQGRFRARGGLLEFPHACARQVAKDERLGNRARIPTPAAPAHP